MNFEVDVEDSLIELVYYTRGTQEELFSKELYLKFRNQIEKLTHIFLDNDGFTYGGKLVYENNTVTDYDLDDEYFPDYEDVDMDDTKIDIEEYWVEGESIELD